MTVEKVIVAAIQNGRRVRVMRDGQERIICPYRIGWSNENNHNVLHYQIAGFSQRGLEPVGSSANWRCHELESFATAEIIEGEFIGPTVKPRTRGACVVRLQVEVANYYAAFD
jgi:hypothetical protein